MQYSVKFVKHFIVKQFKNSTHKILILSRVEKWLLSILFPVPLIRPVARGVQGDRCTPLSSERGYNDVFAPTPLDTYLSVGVYVCVGDMETPQHGNGTKIIFEEFPFF